MSGVPAALPPLDPAVMQRLLEVDLSASMHQAGIPIRHLGLLRSMFWHRLPHPALFSFKSRRVVFLREVDVPDTQKERQQPPETVEE